MAVTRHSNFDRTVNTIAERNAITRRVDGMMVTVKDAIADVDAGAGKAVYRWDASDLSWILIFKSTYETVSYVTEELTIVNGAVTASNYPVDNTIWEISVIDGNDQIAFPRLSDLTISLGVINLGTSFWDNKKLRFTYAYGSISQQLNSVLSTKADVVDISIGSY